MDIELKKLPESLRNEVQRHLSSGYKIESYENSKVTMMKKKRMTIGMIIISILTLRWIVYKWLPNILIIDIIGIKYYLYIEEVNNEIKVTTG